MTVSRDGRSRRCAQVGDEVQNLADLLKFEQFTDVYAECGQNSALYRDVIVKTLLAKTVFLEARSPKLTANQLKNIAARHHPVRKLALPPLAPAPLSAPA